MSSQLEKGRKVGQFEIVGILGKGGMASVYRAYQPNLEREVAIKVMADNYASDTTFVERFRREARSIARLRHPNILTVYDAGEDNGLLYIAMELIDGPTLKEEMHGRPLPVDKAIKYISQVASALDYANRMGIIHRDVKPTNVLIDQGERAVLSDFGIAKLAEQAAGNQLTSTGTGVGTPDYMSPEQALGEELDARSDQYSLGVMLYELLTGRTPYTGDTPIAVVMGHVSKPLPSARQLNPQIPESVETVLAKALAKKPVDRYESSAAFSEALQEAWHNRDAHSEPTRLVGSADTALEPTQQVTPVARPGSGPYNPEAEQLYAEGRRQEQLNNFYGAFDAFSRLDNRFPRYKDVPTILERYRVMGYGQNRPVSWQTVQPNPGVSGQYGTPGSFVNKQPSGQYSTPYNTHVPQTSTPYSFNQGTIAPARKNGLPVVPIIIGIVAVAVLAIVLIIVLAGGNKTSGDQSNQAFAATAVPTGTSTSSENATTEAATTESNTTVADTTEAVKPTPAITVVVPTRKPVAVTSQTPSTAKAGPEKYTSFSASDGSWSAEIPDSWDKSDDASGVSLTPKADPLTQIEVLSEDLGTATLSQDLVEGIVKSYLEGYGAKIDRQEKRKIDGIDATLYIGTFDSSGFKLDMRLATVAKGEKLYLLLFASLPNTANSSQREAVFDHLLNTINFK